MWKPFDTLKPFHKLPPMHWPYNWDIYTDTTKTAFIPFAIVLCIAFALWYSAERFWQDVVMRGIRVMIKTIKKESTNG